jgi:hypothetical protein
MCEDQSNTHTVPRRRDFGLQDIPVTEKLKGVEIEMARTRLEQILALYLVVDEGGFRVVKVSTTKN